jgi:small nuclear ribonucleoprotein (snRNP)-like protein
MNSNSNPNIKLNNNSNPNSQPNETPTAISKGEGERVGLTVIRGDQVIEVHQRFADWAVQG